MRDKLEMLSNRINRIDTDNLYKAISRVKDVMQELVVLLDQALPKEVEPD